MTTDELEDYIIEVEQELAEAIQMVSTLEGRLEKLHWELAECLDGEEYF